MRHLRSTWQTVKILLAAVAGWLTLARYVLAEEDGGATKGGSFAAPYMVVIFCIALGMLMVCLSQRRRERGKSEYTDRKRPMQIEL